MDVAPIRHHVAIKRYLAQRLGPEYVAALSPASRETLRHQGGPMTLDEADAFARSMPQATLDACIAVRWYDDGAKVPGVPTKSVAEYLRQCLD